MIRSYYAAFALSFMLILTTFVLAPACRFRVERKPEILVWHMPSDPVTLNPLLAYDEASFTVLNNIYDRLIERDNETLEFKPKLAKGWEISADRLKYTFTLRDDVKWHDGAPFTADDVIYSFQKINDPMTDTAFLRAYFSNVVSAKKIAEDKIEFVCKKPYFKMTEILGNIPIVPQHVFGNNPTTDFNTHPAGRLPVGNGPFKFVKWITGSKIELKRNENYWGEKPAIEGIVFKIAPDQNIAFEMAKKGALDLIRLRPMQWTRQTEKEAFNEKFEKIRFWNPNYSFIIWNSKRPFFKNRRVRIAMDMLINKKEILDKLLFSLGELISGPAYRYGKYYDENIEPYPYNPELARKILAQEGWADKDGDRTLERDGVPFEFKYLTRAGVRLGQNLCLCWEEELRYVGIKMEIVTLEWATLVKMVSDRNFDAVILGRAIPYDEDLFQSWHSSQIEKGSNIGGFQNAEADELLEEARGVFDSDKRAVIYKKLHRIIHEEEPAAFLFTYPTLLAVSKRFSNVEVYKTGPDIMEWNVGPSEKLFEW